MAPYAESLTYLFAVGVVCLDVVLAIMVVSRVSLGAWLPASMLRCVHKWGMHIAAVCAVSAVLVSLWYSEIVGLPVCALCWFSRTMMYPLAVLLVMAVIRKDRSITPYAVLLAGIGMLITGYHHLYQVGLVKGTLCTALVDGGDCARRYVYEFDMVTMPLMGFTFFATIALMTWIARTTQDNA